MSWQPPFTSLAAAAASATDKAEASAAAKAKANASAMNGAADWLRQSAAASAVAPTAVSAPAPNLLPPRPPQTCSRTNGEGFVVDLPYQMHNNYES